MAADQVKLQRELVSKRELAADGLKSSAGGKHSVEGAIPVVDSTTPAARALVRFGGPQAHGPMPLTLRAQRYFEEVRLFYWIFLPLLGIVCRMGPPKQTV